MQRLLVVLVIIALCGGGAVAQVPAPDQGAAPPTSNPNMGDGTGSGPAGSIGDPNGTGPGSAAPESAPSIVDQPVSERPSISKGDMLALKACLAMSGATMTASAKCRTLRARNPEVFSSPPPAR